MHPAGSVPILSLCLALGVTGCLTDDIDPELSDVDPEVNDGTTDGSSPALDATVWVGAGCTGALVTPRIVLTAGHCVDRAYPLVPNFVASTAADGDLYAIGTDGVLYKRSVAEIPAWADAGDSGGVITSLTASSSRLYGLRGGRIYRRDLTSTGAWTDDGAAPSVIAIAVDPTSSTLWAVSATGQLLRRTASGGTFEDQRIVSGMRALAVAAEGRLFGLGTNGRLYHREGTGWADLGVTSPALSHIAAAGGRLFGVSSGGYVYAREPGPYPEQWTRLGAVAGSYAGPLAATTNDEVIGVVSGRVTRRQAYAQWRRVETTGVAGPRAMTVTADRFFVAGTTSLYTKLRNTPGALWQNIGASEGASALATDGTTLYAAIGFNIKRRPANDSNVAWLYLTRPPIVAGAYQSMKAMVAQGGVLYAEAAKQYWAITISSTSGGWRPLFAVEGLVGMGLDGATMVGTSAAPVAVWQRPIGESSTVFSPVGPRINPRPAAVWTSLSPLVTVKVGRDRLFPTATFTANRYAIAGLEDILLLELSAAVPADKAIPMSIHTVVPGRATPATWVPSQTYKMGGWGRTAVSYDWLYRRSLSGGSWSGHEKDPADAFGASAATLYRVVDGSLWSKPAADFATNAGWTNLGGAPGITQLAVTSSAVLGLREGASGSTAATPRLVRWSSATATWTDVGVVDNAIAIAASSTRTLALRSTSTGLIELAELPVTSGATWRRLVDPVPADDVLAMTADGDDLYVTTVQDQILRHRIGTSTGWSVVDSVNSYDLGPIAVAGGFIYAGAPSAPPRLRQYVMSASAAHGYGGDPNFLTANGANGSGMLPGDSGSPLRWRASNTAPWTVVGVCQGWNRFVSTFGTGWIDGRNEAHPNVGAWLRFMVR